MKPLKTKNIKIFDWYEVIRAFANHTGMSFDSHGHWGLDYTKVCGEPCFEYSTVLQFEQNYLYPYRTNYRYESNLQKILEESKKVQHDKGHYYKIKFYLVINYLIAHKILPEDSFFVTNISI
jgi:hypothetical protein